MKKNKNIFVILFLIILTIFYFEYSVSITWDSAHYLGYVKILERIVPLSSWDVVRGPIFPLIIYFSNFLFSKTSHGLIMLTYLYYLIMLLYSGKIIDYFLNNIFLKKKVKKVLKYIFILLIIINPIIFGYYHTLLTEFVAITLSVISCYYSVKWLDVDYFSEKRKYILLNLLFIFLTLFSWFLKQPYVSCGFFSLFVSYIISLFQYKNIKQFIVRTITILSCVICLFIGIKVWNSILNSFGNDTSTTRNPTNALGNQLVKAPDYIEINNDDEIFDKNFIKKSKLSKHEKKDIFKLLSNNNKYILVYVYNDKDRLIDVDYIESSNGTTISMSSSVIYLLCSFVENPVKFTDSYITNYFSIIDIYATTTENGVHYDSTKKIDLDFSNEITTIGSSPYYMENDNLFPLSDELYKNALYYEDVNYANKYLNGLMQRLFKLFLFVFKVLFFLLPILLIVSIILRISKKFKKYSKILNLIIILLGFSFLHVLLHTVTGAIIDRYALPAFITTFFGFLMLVVLLVTKKNKI